MSTDSKAFYRLTCDYPGCGVILSTAESAYFPMDDIRPFADESGWLIGDDPLNDQHSCFDHWVYCEGCDVKVPLWRSALVNGDLWYCRPCDRRLAEALDG